VFDVDLGTRADVENSRALLSAAGLAQHWYTSVSFGSTPGPIENWRLIVPLSAPLSRDGWLRVRADFIRRFELCVEVEKCKGFSHPYYLPARLKGAPSRAVAVSGVAYEPSFSSVAPAAAPVLEDDEDDDSEAPPTTPEILETLRTRLVRTAQRYEDSGDALRASMLRRALAGEDIADGVLLKSKSGDPPLAAVTMIVVRALPFPQSIDTYVALLEPSRSHTTVPAGKFREMVRSAIRKKRDDTRKDEELREALTRASNIVARWRTE
jgi:hypothetical protein